MKSRPLKFVVLVVAIATFAAIARAQNASENTAVISGTVVDSITKQPLKAVEVRARSFSPGQHQQQATAATTDAEGHFTFDGMAPGRYFFSAMRQGYVGQRLSGAGSSGRTMVIGPDQHTSDLVIELVPGANVSGHVKNSDGKILPGISLEVVKYSQEGGGKQLHGVTAPSVTDAAGEYRIAALPPGHYYLRAIPPMSKDVAKAAKETYAPTYYPNGSDVATAAPLSVRPGQDLAGMDITLTPVHAVTITGKVLIAGTSTPAPGAEVTLINDDSGSQVSATTDAKGAFELPAIPSRDYILVARVEPKTSKSKMLWGQRTLHVADGSVRNANFVVGSGVPVSGRLRLDDKTNPDSARVDLSQITANLQPEGNPSVTALMPEVNSATVKPDGTFTFIDVPAGTYTLDFNSLPSGYYLKSTGAIDLLENGVTIANNQSPPLLDLALSQNSAQLSGTATSEQMPASGAVVVLIPQGGRNGSFRFYKRSMTDQSGRFSIKGIVPGDYKVLALLGMERVKLGDPDFLQQFEDRGETMHFQEGSTLTVSLDAIPADESSP